MTQWPKPFERSSNGSNRSSGQRLRSVFRHDDRAAGNHRRRKPRRRRLAGVRVQVETRRSEAAPAVRRAAPAAARLANVVCGAELLPNGVPWFSHSCFAFRVRPKCCIDEEESLCGQTATLHSAVLYDYRFTDFTAGRATGAWWQRERRGYTARWCRPRWRSRRLILLRSNRQTVTAMRARRMCRRSCHGESERGSADCRGRSGANARATLRLAAVTAFLPSNCSMRRSCCTCHASVRLREPVLIWPALVCHGDVRDGCVFVSPERWLITAVYLFSFASSWRRASR